jgi:low temperature requirement protein LtrA
MGRSAPPGKTVDVDPTQRTHPETLTMNLLRNLQPHQHARVCFIELFFDLVFVFAITQLSHALLDNLTPLGALQTLILFMAVWWAWIDTAWVTNWLDPARWPVRLMLLVLMLASLVLSTSLPEAFGDRGLFFAIAYAFIQFGRALFTMFAFRGWNHANYLNFQRISTWFALYGVLWIAGGLADGETRLAIWITAVVIENIGPAVRFWTPWLGVSRVADWAVEGAHMAERCGLFIIIALGESILVTGATFAGAEWTTPTVCAFVVAFIGSVAMWWIYFDTGQEYGTESITHAAEPGRLARLAYTYLHMPIIAGIVVSAVGDELVLAHPEGHMEAGMVATLAGGPALYLIGTILFRRAVLGAWPLTHVAGVVVLGLLALASHGMSALGLSTAVMIVLVLVAAGETMVMRMRRGAAA